MRKFLVLILIFSTIVAFGQIREISRQAVDAQLFKLDKLGSYYLANKNELQKTDKKLNKICTWDEYSYGDISFVDVSDPMRILVYYKNFNKILFLDNTLSLLREPLSLDDVGFYSIGAVASSNFGGVWLYDNIETRLIQLDKNLNISIKGANLFSEIGDSQVVEILVGTNYIVLKTDNGQIVILDKFANFYSKLSVSPNASVCIDNGVVYFVDQSVLYLYDINRKQQSKLDLPVKNITDFVVSGSYIYILDDKSLITFEILP
ncbi:MAG: hypothetical protein JXR36_15755 [Bacteroidales bacterium]|nr:hypothetical protein [Bacteroidales bacterium]